MASSGIQSEIIPQHLDNRPELRYLRHVKEGVCAAGPEVWFDLGIELLDQNDVTKLNVIKSDTTKILSERCSEMFKLWLQRRPGPDASWRCLITALKKIDMNNLAYDVEKLLTSEGVATIDQQVMQEGHQVFQTQPLLSHDQLRADFGRMLMDIRSILSESPKKKNNLKKCKELCIYLKASDSANALLFSPEKCTKINKCSDFRQLFEILNQHLNWDELSILTQIIDICGSDEAKQEFDKYKKKMAVSRALEIISSTKSNPPPGFERFCLKIDKPYKRLTVEEYEEIKEFIFKNLDTHRYVTDEYIRVLFDSLHLEWHVTSQATPHMIKRANAQKAFFKKSLIVFMQVGEKIIINIHTKQTSAEFSRLTDEFIITSGMADTIFPVTIKDASTKKIYTINVSIKWNVAQIKKEVAHVSKSALLPNRFQLVFAGTELKDHMTLKDIGVQNTSILHCVPTANVEIQPLTPSSPVMKDVNLSSAEPTSPVNKTAQKNQFYVYCKEPCNGMMPGKIRVRCAECKDTSFVLTQGPCNWKDVLMPRHIRGHCNNGSCKGDVAEFYFKCAKHDTLDEDTSVPLHMIRSNNMGVECITCATETELVIVFDCDVGHSMCIDCFVAYIKDALNHRNFKEHPRYGYTIQCPDGCADSEVKEIHHFRVIGEKEYERYHRFGAEECLLKMGGIFCPAVGCGAGQLPEPGQQRIECVECKFVFCSECRNAYHTGSCATAVVQQAVQEKNSNRFNQYAERASWVVASKRYVRQISKACPRCSAAVDKIDRCNHMTCSVCKFEFCWLCLIKWGTDCQDRHWFL